MSSLNQQEPPLLQDVIDQMRDNILRSQSTSNTTAITSFDNLVAQLKIFVNQINAQSAEIKRLQELCTKNKIDFAIPIENSKIKLPTNTGVIPPKKENNKE